jgi:replicative DNA helicase
MNTETTTLPCSIEVEEEIMGCLLTDTSDDTLEMIEQLNPEDFFQRSHRLIFESIKRLHGKNQPFDLISLTTNLSDLNLLQDVGGHYNLSVLSTKYTPGFNPINGIEVLKEKTRLRRILELCEEVKVKAYNSESTEEIINATETKLSKITENISDESLVSSGVKQLKQMIEARKTGEKIYGYKTGIKAFDDVFHGVQKSQYTIIAARPSDGKTSIVDQMSIAFMMEGIPFLYVPLESSEDRIIGKQACKMCKISYSRFLKGLCNESELQAIDKASDFIARSSMIMRRPKRYNADSLRSLILREIRKNDIKIVVIDYIQKLVQENSRDYKIAVSNASSEIQNLCVDTGIAAIVLCQLNRSAETEKRPRMAHLKESGQIEQDADNICLLWGEVEKHEVKPGECRPMILTIEKNKDGISGVDQKMDFDQEQMTFKERNKYGI